MVTKIVLNVVVEIENAAVGGVAGVCNLVASGDCELERDTL